MHKKKYSFKIYDGHKQVKVISAYSEDDAWEKITAMYPNSEFIDIY